MPGYLDLFVGYTINFVVISYCPRTEDDFVPKRFSIDSEDWLIFK